MLEKMSPYLDLKYGTDVLEANTFYSASLGWRFPLGKRCGLSVSVGYVMQTLEKLYIDDNRELSGDYMEYERLYSAFS